MIDTITRWKKIWYISFIVLILVMISVGGITRLTRSGLSIVEWKPVSGIIPPVTEQDWQQQFDLYKTSPEFQQINSHFELDDYKNIFIWEYLHRVLGRIIFLVALIPGLIFWRKKWISGYEVFAFSSLVTAQGLIGWLMVKTGLNTNPHVSPYMLALHFFSAQVLLLTVYYQLCRLRAPLKAGFDPLQKKLFSVLGALLILQIFYGCLTSGLKAGFAFNTYPLMAGNFFPPGGLVQDPIWINFFENPSAVQWVHRWLGMTTFIVMLITVLKIMKSPLKPVLKGPFMHLFGITFLQIILGILNLIFVVPHSLAIIHQLFASMILMAYFSIHFRLKKE